MLTDLFLAQRLMEERVKDALRVAEEGRLVKKARRPKKMRPFLLSAMQYLSDWWDGGNGRDQPTTEHMGPWKKANRT
jgi:hypothetical protein